MEPTDKIGLECELTWVATGIVPNWTLFFPNFVLSKTLCPVLAIGSIHDAVQHGEVVPWGTTHSVTRWAPIEIRSLRVCVAETLKVPSDHAGFYKFWVANDFNNGIFWNTGLDIYGIHSGTDYFCIAAPELIVKKLFSRPIEQIDLDLTAFCIDMLNQAQRTKLDPLADVWMRNLAWIRCFR